MLAGDKAHHLLFTRHRYLVGKLQALFFFFFYSPSPGLPFQLLCVLVNATYYNFSHLFFTPFVGGSLRGETIGSGPGRVWPSALLMAKATNMPEGGG